MEYIRPGGTLFAVRTTDLDDRLVANRETNDERRRPRLMHIRRPSLEPVLGWNPLKAHLGSIALAAAGVALLIGFGLFRVIERTETTRDYARAEFLAGQTGMNAVRAIEIAERAGAPPPPPPGSASPSGQPPSAERDLPPGEVVELSRLIKDIERDAREVHVILHDGTGSDLNRAAATASKTLDAFLQQRSEGDIEKLTGELISVSVNANELLPVIDTWVGNGTARTVDAARGTMLWLLIAIPLASFGVAFTAWVLGRRMRQALDVAAEEQRNLEQSAALMNRRNGQFQALYNVITEVTESLSLRYVVDTTLRETSRLVAADVVVVRLLEGDQLVVAGTSQGIDGPVLRNVTLGSGIVGRAGRRGRSALISKDAEKLMSNEERIAWAESGLVVPLIVGARVVGTLGCWSKQRDVFDEEDQQVLEMMASQVAVAVAAASTHEASEREAHQDPLTGIPNRRQLTRDIRERFAPALLAGQPLAFTMVDIDHFKRFNDSYGHKVGDVTLQKVAAVLRSSIRTSDRLYRYGGEEFTIVFDGAEGDDAVALMERVRQSVARTQLTGKDGEPVGQVTISSGIACGPQNGVDCDLLIRLADDALYQSKWTGRDRITLYSDSIAAMPDAA